MKYSVSTSRDLAKTQLTTPSSLKAEWEKKELRDENLKPLPKEAINKAYCSLAGAFPYLANGLSALCSRYLVDDNGERIIKRIGDPKETHYLVKLPWKKLCELCIDNDPAQIKEFTTRLEEIHHKPIMGYVRLPNFILSTQLVNVVNITHKDPAEMTPREIELCQKIGIAATIDSVEIEFFKPLFPLIGENKNGKVITIEEPYTRELCQQTNNGYFRMDPAAFSKLKKTMDDILNSNELFSFIDALFNPATDERLTFEPQAVYKFYMYFLLHLGERCSKTLTLNILDLFKFVLPGFLTNRGRTLKNPYSARLWLHGAGFILNRLASFGRSSQTDAAIINMNFDDKNNVTIGITREKPYTNIPQFNSNVFSLEPVKDYVKQPPETVEDAIGRLFKMKPELCGNYWGWKWSKVRNKLDLERRKQEFIKALPKYNLKFVEVRKIQGRPCKVNEIVDITKPA